ncbi:MAG: RsmB/NOP family class I SAM-dependent RNA methyltransferase [Gammaproteobacteria bacterium]|nr:RsmB/NOP family class I SAM-dependent RNA methyltransferase [Gammaproteobacteria bacterium]
MAVTASPPLRRAQARFAAEALATIFTLKQPADAVLDELFRANRQMGARDRRLVGDLVYGVLRDLRRLQSRAGGTQDPAQLCSEFLAAEHGMTPDALAAIGLPPARQATGDDALPPDVRANLPDWLFASLSHRHEQAEIEALAQALRRPAPVDLRVNTLRATREAAVAALAEDGIAAAPTPLSPVGLRLPKRGPLQNTQAFRLGWVEPQDEGSQLLALLLGVKPGETVVDFCAGGGGKTLALAAQMQNRGTLHAFDISRARLRKLQPRVERAGIAIVRPLALRDEQDAALAALAGTADAVLVDAPCSGSGTLRRNPELALRPVDLAQLQARQLAILGAAARLVRPGGRLLYATCSLATEENEDVVKSFLSTNPGFAEADAGEALRAQGVPYEGARLKLLPHKHGTDGFFAALLVCKAGSKGLDDTRIMVG